jgi:hypothetical protein
MLLAATPEARMRLRTVAQQMLPLEHRQRRVQMSRMGLRMRKQMRIICLMRRRQLDNGNGTEHETGVSLSIFLKVSYGRS